MKLPISRHFATLGQRQVHYRRAGSGCPVLLLHQTPMSSAELVPLMLELAPTYTVLAPDMPGYGASDPLLEIGMTMEVLVDNLADFLDELGIGRVAIYGFHTGASLATAFARRHPRRVVVAIADGLLCLNDEERREFLQRYLPPFEPRGDGSHLAWLWTRLKDQSVFFPWYRQTDDARLQIDGAQFAVLDAKIRDWLRSGSHYRCAYAAAIAYDPIADLGEIVTSHYLLGQRGDPLAAHWHRLPALSGNIHRQTYSGARELAATVMAILAKHAVDHAAPERQPTRPLEGRIWQDYVLSHGHQLRVLRSGAHLLRPTLILHGAQSSLRACTGLAQGFASDRAVCAVELPGHGETDPITGNENVRLEDLAELLKGALQTLQLGSCDMIGIGAGGAVQAEFLRSSAACVNSLTLIDPVDLSRDSEMQAALLSSYRSPECDSYGGFLLRAWHEVRDHLLFFPWFERRRAYAVEGSVMLQPEFLQGRTVDLLLSGGCGVALRKAELRYPLEERLRAAQVPLRFAAAIWEPRLAHSKRLSGNAGRCLELPRDPAAWASALKS